MKIQLIANGSTKWQRFIKRWGISFLIDEDVLFDAFGDVRVFMANVQKQGINLSKIKHIVISHDDWDHIAGLWEILKQYKNLNVYVGPHFNHDLKNTIRSFGANLIETPDPIMIKPCLYTTGELAGPSMRGILYEQSLIIKHPQKLSIMTGCAHPKLANILQTAINIFPQRIDFVIGGFHLKEASLKEILQTIQELQEYNVKNIIPLHCTGTMAVKELKKTFLEHCLCLQEGDIVEV